MTTISLNAAVAVAETLRQVDPAAYAAILDQLGLSSHPPKSEWSSQCRKAYEFIERKGGEIGLDDWRRRTKGKSAEEAFAELNALVQMGVAQWQETPSTAGRVRREIVLL